MRSHPHLRRVLALDLDDEARMPLRIFETTVAADTRAGSQRIFKTCSISRKTLSARQRDRRLMAAIRSAVVYIRVSQHEAVATRSNAIFNASARLHRPATYPQTPRSGACLHRLRFAAASCLRPRQDGRSNASATAAWWLRQRAGDHRESRDNQKLHGKPPWVRYAQEFTPYYLTRTASLTNVNRFTSHA